MMPHMSRTRTLIILLLALILPVQGIAAAFAPVHRAMNPNTMTAMADMPCHTQMGEHATQGGDHAPASTHQQDSDIAPHACCHQVMNAVSGALVPAVARKFGDVSQFVLPLATLYIPDSPDRPPRG